MADKVHLSPKHFSIHDLDPDSAARQPLNIPIGGGWGNWNGLNTYNDVVRWGQSNGFAAALPTFFFDSNGNPSKIGLKRSAFQLDNSAPATIQDFGATIPEGSSSIVLPSLRDYFTKIDAKYASTSIVAGIPTCLFYKSGGDYPYAELVLCRTGSALHTSFPINGTPIDLNSVDNDPSLFIAQVYQHCENTILVPGYRRGYPDFQVALDPRPGIGWVVGVTLFADHAIEMHG